MYGTHFARTRFPPYGPCERPTQTEPPPRRSTDRSAVGILPVQFSERGGRGCADSCIYIRSGLLKYLNVRGKNMNSASSRSISRKYILKYNILLILCINIRLVSSHEESKITFSRFTERKFENSITRPTKLGTVPLLC